MQPPPGEPSLGDSFLIVTEGEVTEKLYFESVRATLQLNPVTVHVVHPHYTDAEGLVRAAMDMYELDRDGKRLARAASGNRAVKIFDHVWVLFDTDVSARQNQLPTLTWHRVRVRQICGEWRASYPVLEVIKRGL
jgi:hypothetical protein